MASQPARVPCAFYRCPERTKLPHNLCAAHWLMRFDRAIVKCRQCRTYRPAEEPQCENCDAERDRLSGRRKRGGRKTPA